MKMTTLQIQFSHMYFQYMWQLPKNDPGQNNFKIRMVKSISRKKDKKCNVMLEDVFYPICVFSDASYADNYLL